MYVSRYMSSHVRLGARRVDGSAFFLIHAELIVFILKTFFLLSHDTFFSTANPYHVAATGVWDFAADSIGIAGSICQNLGSESYSVFN